MYQFGFDQEIRVAWSDMGYGFIVGSAQYITVGHVKNLGGFCLCLLVVWSVGLTGGKLDMKQAEQRQTGACRDKPEPVKAKQTPRGQTGIARVFHQLLVKARVTCRSSWHLGHGTARAFAPGHGEAEGEDLGRS